MMKRSKVVPRSSARPRERSPLRKMHSPRKSALHRSPQHSSRPSHSNIRRSSSSSMKRGTPSVAKHMRSPPVQSPSPSSRLARNRSNDSSAARRRLPPKKQYELVKRRSPHSPVSHSMAPRDIPIRSISPPQTSRYQSARGREPDQDFDSPPKKKLQRVTERYASNHSPPRIPISRPMLRQSESSSGQRGDPGSHQGPMHPSARDFAMSHSNDRPSSSHFPSQGDNHDGYLRSTLEKLKRQHDEPPLYMSEKRFAPTLDQRFSSDSNRGMEPRIPYSRSDLEKITIDIRPAVRESSPTVRRIVNPDEVKLVRRPSEGKKPIFDREEIKQAPRDLREDAHYEHRNISTLVTSNISHYGMTRRELENYEITRHKFDSFHGPSSSNEMRTLNDRWQKLDSKKIEPSYFDRDERTAQSYAGKSRNSESYSDEERPIPRCYDRDYRDDKFSQGGEPTYHRDDYPDNHRPLSSSPADLRHSLSVRRKEDVPDSRDRMLNRREDEPRSHWHSVPKSVPDSSSDKMRGKRSISRGSRPLSPGWDYEPESSRGNPRGEKLPSFAQRSERFKYPSWSEKPEGPSRSPSYFEHDNRYSSEVSRFRSTGRPTSGRIFRSRPYRGGMRGGMRGRGMFRGSNSRGMGYSSRGMK